MLRPDHFLRPTPKGLYCLPGDFYLDPVRSAVDKAIISHGHSDHARGGHGSVLATPDTVAIMRIRYGDGFAQSVQSLNFGETINVNGVSITFIPAGHILGSAQIVLEHRGLKAVFSGDYKRRDDPTCKAFEVVDNAHIFISEATFGLPVFHHPDTGTEIDRLLKSVQTAKERTHCVGAYSLGKAQRVIRHLRLAGYDAPIYIHGALGKISEHYQDVGIDLGELRPATLASRKKSAKEAFRGQIIVAPPSAFGTVWGNRFPDPLLAFASGWMHVRQRAKAAGIELPLIISDHADWAELTGTIEAMNPEEVWITYGREDALVRWAELNGRKAKALRLVGHEEEGSNHQAPLQSV